MMQRSVLFPRLASLLAGLALIAGARADRVEFLWQKVPGDYAWIGGAGSNTERGVAYNPVTKHVLVPGRSGGTFVHILDAETGAEVMGTDGVTPKVLDMTGVSQGTFVINMAGVGDDGVIYVCNLTTGSTSASSPFKIYRWENEDAVPTVAYSGDPSEGVSGAVRFGDSFAVRGGGTVIQLMAGARATAHVAIFTTADGQTFTSKLVAGAGVSTGQLGVAFGAGDTGWSKLNGSNPLRHFSFDLGTKTATLVEGITVTPTTIAPLGTDPTGKYLGVIATDAQATARVYDVSVGGATIIGDQKFSTSNSNGNGIGGVDIGDGKAFFVNPNNGILALKIVTEVTPVSIQTQPQPISVIEGGKATFTVSASGTPPLSYQWMHAGTNLSGATSGTLTVAGVNADNAGDYTVTVSNGAGPVTSDPATLTVVPIVSSSQLNLKWKILPGDRAWIANDNNTRGVAINKVTGNVLVVSRTGLANGAADIYVLDGTTGVDKYKLTIDSAIIRKGTFFINMIGVADDGAVYACNLTTSSTATGFEVYRWASDAADAAPVLVYSGDPANGNGRGTGEDTRFGDSFDVRGSGANTQILVGSRNGNIASIIFPSDDPLSFGATAILSDGPDGEFGLGVAFGPGNSIYGTSNSALLRLVTFDDPLTGFGGIIPGTVSKAYTNTEVPTTVSNIAYDPATKYLGAIAIENPDNVRLYEIADDGTATLKDQELFELDNANLNGTGSLDFGDKKLVALDTNNGIMMFDFSTTAVVAGAATLSNAHQTNDGKFQFTIAGTIGASYTVQVTTSLTPPVSWGTLTTVTIGATGSETVTDATPGGGAAHFYRAVAP